MESLLATAPGASNIRPARVTGFCRTFCVYDSVGWTSTNLDVAGSGFWAVGVQPAHGQTVNGVVFEIEEGDYQALQAREATYRVDHVSVHDYETGSPLGVAAIFVAPARSPTLNERDPAQRRYLEICLRGASTFGEAFLDEFVASTWLGDRTIDDECVAA
jgi:cation transport regulator ChaC